uniref:hypothetical protein n=1 Tax=Inonotus hispidus TaxID=40469 RepID=UPI0021821225|nr:hypothetical protein N4M07_mgp005 [Inonotus hispidus]UVF37943.1 hypothetical protein [Inonotus hispidus]
MKLRQIIITLVIVIATAMITIFPLGLLNNLESVNIVTSQNNTIINNQVSTRDLNNITSNFNNTNSTVISNNETSPTSWILAVALLGGAVVVGGLTGIAYCSGAMDISTTSEPGTFELAERN